jgi:hypothetical protein
MLIGVLPLLAGVAIVAVGAVRLRRNRRLRKVGISVTATVVDNQLIGGTEGRLMFAPVIVYRTREGREIKTAASHQSYKSYIAGSAIEVLYDPDQPDRVLVPGQSSGPYVAIVFGLVFVGFGIVTIVVSGVMAGLIGNVFGDAGTIQPELPDFPPSS